MGVHCSGATPWTLFRNWFLAINFMAVILYTLLPTAPPRMIFTSGVVDISFLHGVRPDILENGLLANPFAAMPSLHFGYALFIGLILFTLARQPLAALRRLPVRRSSCWWPSSRPATTSSSTPSAGALVVAGRLGLRRQRAAGRGAAAPAVTVRERDG